MNMIKKIIEIIKAKKFTYLIESDVITIFTGTLCVFIQLEKEDTAEDYEYMQIWISDEECDLDGIYHETHEDLANDELDTHLTTAIDFAIEQNKNLGILSNMFRKIEEFAKEKEVPKSVVEIILNDLDLEY